MAAQIPAATIVIRIIDIGKRPIRALPGERLQRSGIIGRRTAGYGQSDKLIAKPFKIISVKRQKKHQRGRQKQKSHLKFS